MSGDPRILKLETTGRCNAACVFCGHPAGGEHMAWETFTSVIDAFPGAADVQPQFYGEPLLWPHIADGIRYAKDAGKTVRFYTNGSLLRGQLALDIAAARPDVVIFSVDTHLPALYERLRPPLKFADVRENIERFQMRREPGTRTVVRATHTKETGPTMDATVAYWDEFVDHVVVKPEVSKTREVSDYERIACRQPSYLFVVKADGTCVLCCGAWQVDDAPIGHVSEGPRKVWERYEEFTKRPHEFCRECFHDWTSA